MLNYHPSDLEWLSPTIFSSSRWRWGCFKDHGSDVGCKVSEHLTEVHDCSIVQCLKKPSRSVGGVCKLRRLVCSQMYLCRSAGMSTLAAQRDGVGLGAGAQSSFS